MVASVSKPKDIPQDVWDRAAMLWGHEARIGIARAILAERERCAKVVEDGYVCRTCGHVGAIEHGPCDDWSIDGASNEQVAAAIRKGTA